MQQHKFNLQGRVTDQPQDLGLRRFLRWHQIHDRDAQRANILLVRNGFVHNKDIFLIENFLGRQMIGDLDRHSAHSFLVVVTEKNLSRMRKVVMSRQSDPLASLISQTACDLQELAPCNEA